MSKEIEGSDASSAPKPAPLSWLWAAGDLRQTRPSPEPSPAAELGLRPSWVLPAELRGALPSRTVPFSRDRCRYGFLRSRWEPERSVV